MPTGILTKMVLSPFILAKYGVNKAYEYSTQETTCMRSFVSNTIREIEQNYNYSWRVGKTPAGRRAEFRNMSNWSEFIKKKYNEQESKCKNIIKKFVLEYIKTNNIRDIGYRYNDTLDNNNPIGLGDEFYKNLMDVLVPIVTSELESEQQQPIVPSGGKRRTRKSKRSNKKSKKRKYTKVK
jgi:hypothetical protein